MERLINYDIADVLSLCPTSYDGDQKESFNNSKIHFKFDGYD